MENNQTYEHFLSAFKYFIEKQGYGGQTPLALSIGKSTSLLSLILNKKKRASFDTQIAIAKSFGYTYEEFLAFGRQLIEQGEVPKRQIVTKSITVLNSILGPDDEPQKPDICIVPEIPVLEYPPDTENYCYVPMAENRLSAGGGQIVLSEEVNNYYAFRKRWLRWIAKEYKKVILMKVSGDSMESDIKNNDTVMVDLCRNDVLDGKIYAIGIDNTISVKCLENMPNERFRVISFNKNYSSYEIDKSQIRVIGQIIWIARQVL